MNDGHATVGGSLHNASPEIDTPEINKIMREAELEPKKVPTESEYKKAMGLFFTVKHPTVQACGHKIDIKREPRNNCNTCWMTWLNENSEYVNTADKILNEEGIGMLLSLRGKKFVKYFLKFMMFLSQIKPEVQELPSKEEIAADSR